MKLKPYLPFAAGLIAVSACKSTHSTLDDVVPFRDGAAIASLGDSYNSLSQKLNPSASCVSGEVVSQDSSSSRTQMDVNQSANKLMSELSGEVDGTPRFAFANINAQGGFYRSLSNNDRSISLVFSSKIETIVDRLTKPTLDSSLVSAAPHEVFSDCGDSFVSQIHKGGRITVTVKLSFSSSENREKWQGLTQLNTPWFKLKKDIKDKASKNSADGILSINIHQEGGDATSAPMATKTCSIASAEDLDSCLDSVNMAIEYATNEFPAQVSSAPAILSYRTEKLNALRGVSGINFKVPQNILKIRSDLKTMLDTQGDFKSAYENAIKMGFSISSDTKSKVDGNLALIQRIAETCYDYNNISASGPQWALCENEFKNLQLADVNPDTLEIKTVQVFANDLNGASIINSYDQGIQVQLKIAKESQWTVDNNTAVNFSGMTENCSGRCPLSNASKGSMVFNNRHQIQQLRESSSEHSIEAGQSLKLYANDNLFGFGDNKGSIAVHYICQDCRGQAHQINGSSGVISNITLNATSSSGVLFRNRSQSPRSFVVNAYGFWSNGKPLVGITNWSGSEGQSGTCGENCLAPQVPVGALVMKYNMGQYIHVNKSSEFILGGGESAEFFMNDSTGGYGNNLGSMDLMIYCQDCKND